MYVYKNAFTHYKAYMVTVTNTSQNIYGSHGNDFSDYCSPRVVTPCSLVDRYKLFGVTLKRQQSSNYRQLCFTHFAKETV